MAYLLNINGEYFDPILGQTIPSSSTPGTLYATDIFNALANRIAPHTHTGIGNLDGYQLDGDSLNLTQDIVFNNTNASSLRSVRFVSQPSVLTGSQDINSIYDVLGDIWINDGNGNNIRVTENGALVPSSVISNLNFVPINIIGAGVSAPLTIPANATYNLLNVFTSSQASVIYLPLISSLPSNGRFFYIYDAGGTAFTHTITVNAANGSSDYFNNGATSFTISASFGYFAIYADNTTSPNQWRIFAQNIFELEVQTFIESSIELDINSTIINNGQTILYGTSGVPNQFNGYTVFEPTSNTTFQGSGGNHANLELSDNVTNFNSCTVTMHAGTTLNIGNGTSCVLTSSDFTTLEGVTHIATGSNASSVSIGNNISGTPTVTSVLGTVNIATSGNTTTTIGNSGATNTLLGTTTATGTNALLGTTFIGSVSGNNTEIGTPGTSTTLGGTYTALLAPGTVFNNQGRMLLAATEYEAITIPPTGTYIVDTNSSVPDYYIGIVFTNSATGVTVQLPGSPHSGRVVVIADVAGVFTTGPSSLTVTGGGHNVVGSSTQVYTSSNTADFFVYRYIFINNQWCAF